MTSPFLRSEEAAEYLRFVQPDGTPAIHELRVWAQRYGVRAFRRGRRLLFDRAELDAAIGRVSSSTQTR